MSGTNSPRFTIWMLLLLLVSMSPVARAQYVHPGGLHTQADLDRMKAKVAAGAHPWIDDWNLLITDSQAQRTYTPGALANMGDNRQRADRDAHAAYLNAIRWYISGDTRYADTAVNILNAWAYAVNQVPTGDSTPGLIGIPIQDFALAGEVLRIYPGWAAADFAQFQSMFTNYLYPVVNSFLTTHNGACTSSYYANWDASNIGALLAMGVLNDDTAWFNQGVAYYKSGAGNGSILNAVFYLWPGNLGQWQEAGRDQEHDQLGIGLLGYAAQTAWNQGVDLFGYSSNRLLAGAEYTGQYNSWLPVPYTTYNNCDNAQQYYVSINGRGRLDDRPVWELVYNHYAVLQGVSAPNSQNMAQLTRPEHGSTDHFGYGTLTFTLDATASTYPPSPAPVAPTSLTATAGVGQVSLSWPRVATANGYNVLRATASGGPFTTLTQMTQSTAPQYTDTTPVVGTTYYYAVQAVNQAGTSGNSTAASAAAVQATPLPTGWDADIGTVQAAGAGSYASVGNNTFLVTGQGSGIGGTGDSFNYAYQQVTGDFTLVARLTGITGNLQNTGLMMRETLAANATTVLMALGSTGGRIAEFGARNGTGANLNWYTGDQFTWVPVWFKLQRSGNVFTGYQSSDGVTWFTVKSTTVTMASTYYIGLAACSGDTSGGTVETSTFDNVSFPVQFTPAVQLASSSLATAVGSAVTFTATLVQPTGTTINPTGTVTFNDGAAALGVKTVTSAGPVAFTTSTLVVGSHTVTATYSGDFFFKSASSPSVAEAIAYQPQTISFPAPASPVTYGTSAITLSATASSGLPVSFSVVSGPASISGNALSILGAGTVVVAANQAGNATYSAAAAMASLTVLSSSTTSPDFSLSSDVTSMQVKSGSSATIPFTVAPANGFSQPVTLSCSVPSVAVVCSFDSQMVTTANGPVATKVVVQYPASVASATSFKSLDAGLPLLWGVFGVFGGAANLRRWRRFAVPGQLPLALLLLGSLAVLAGCGSGDATPSPDVHVLTISATSGQTTHTLSVSLDVTAQ